MTELITAENISLHKYSLVLVNIMLFHLSQRFKSQLRTEIFPNTFNYTTCSRHQHSYYRRETDGTNLCCYISSSSNVARFGCFLLLVLGSLFVFKSTHNFSLKIQERESDSSTPEGIDAEINRDLMKICSTSER